MARKDLPNTGSIKPVTVPKKKHKKQPRPSASVKLPKPKKESHIVKSRKGSVSIKTRKVKERKPSKPRVSYTDYSKKRSKLISQQKKVESKGFKTDVDYRQLPKVSDLKKMTGSERAKWVKIANETTTKYVREHATIRTGEIKITDIDNYKEGYHVIEKKLTYEQFKRREASIKAKQRIAERKRQTEEWMNDPFKLSESEKQAQFEIAKASGEVAYTDAEDWIASLSEGPDIEQMFENAMAGLKMQTPELYDWFNDIFSEERDRIRDDDLFRDRMLKAEGEVPDFDIYYRTSDGRVIPDTWKLIRMTEILIDRPISASDQAKLSKITGSIR